LPRDEVFEGAPGRAQEIPVPLQLGVLLVTQPRQYRPFRVG